MDAVCYRIVVAGQLGPRYAGAFDGMTIEPGDENTAIVGQIRDQSHLQGLLERIASLGLRLVSVTGENGRAALIRAAPGARVSPCAKRSSMR